MQDYFGKGLSGGALVVYPPRKAPKEEPGACLLVEEVVIEGWLTYLLKTPGRESFFFLGRDL